MAARARLHQILEGTDPRWGRPYAILSGTVILVAILTHALSTLPDLTPAAQRGYVATEWVIILLFATDYMLRLISAPKPLFYVFSFWGVVDLIAFLPALLFSGANLQSARAVRLVQLARILKLMRLSRAFDQLAHALRQVRDQLAVFLILTLITLYLSAVGIYVFEHKAQPEVYASVPHALWWSVATLSTVGYGDIYPITAGGRIFTSFVLLIGVAVIAVPTGLISAALASDPDLTSADPDTPKDRATMSD